jgi:hypothetical protein
MEMLCARTSGPYKNVSQCHQQRDGRAILQKRLNKYHMRHGKCTWWLLHNGVLKKCVYISGWRYLSFSEEGVPRKTFRDTLHGSVIF